MQPPSAHPGLTEPVPVDQEFASGPAHVESIGGVTYLVLYVDQVAPAEIGGARERRICKRLIIPNVAAARLARMIAAALAGSAQVAAEIGAAANTIAC